MKRAINIALRFNETCFTWKPFFKGNWLGSFLTWGYFGWLWFCVNWSIYKPYELVDQPTPTEGGRG